jgi:peptidoglycan/LPS O-acetylase OafA/YrhL
MAGAVNTAEVSVSTAKSTAFYRPELDALRFFAFFAVFLTHSLPHTPALYSHYHLPASLAFLIGAIASAGAFGVQLFFLLSSFLITSLLLREKQATGNIHLRAFYLRRILRIWPLYFFALALAVLWPLPARIPLNYLAAYLLLSGNWMTVFFGAPKTFVSILWSVSIEEQFYLSWPLALKKSSRSTLVGLAISLIIIANLTRIYLARGVLYDHTIFPNTFAQLDPIALGILCAVFFQNDARRKWVVRLVLAIGGLLTLIVCGHFSSRADVAFTLLGYPAVALATLALFMAIYGLPFRFKPLIYLGKVSFGLYVYHALALYILGLVLGGKAGTPGRFAFYWFGALGLTIFLASASYRWLETPFLHLKEQFAFVKSRPA